MVRFVFRHPNPSITKRTRTRTCTCTCTCACTCTCTCTCICISVCVCESESVCVFHVYVRESVRVCAHVYFYDLPHWYFFFCYISENIHIYIRVIMNRQGHHNIRNGIVWVQKGHSTCTWTATWCV